MFSTKVRFYSSSQILSALWFICPGRNFETLLCKNGVEILTLEQIDGVDHFPNFIAACNQKIRGKKSILAFPIKTVIKILVTNSLRLILNLTIPNIPIAKLIWNMDKNKAMLDIPKAPNKRILLIFQAPILHKLIPPREQDQPKYYNRS